MKSAAGRIGVLEEQSRRTIDAYNEAAKRDVARMKEEGRAAGYGGGEEGRICLDKEIREVICM